MRRRNVRFPAMRFGDVRQRCDVGETDLINAWVTNLSTSTAPMAGRTSV